MLAIDNRKYERLPVRFPVTQFINSGRVYAEGVDVSFDGVRIKAAAASRQGCQYTLAFALPGTRGMFLSGVEVTHKTNGFEGLRLVHMSPRDQLRFSQWISVQMAGRWFRF